MLYSITKPDNKEHEQLLECLKTILQINPIALKDAKELKKNITCCTTFDLIKPESKPAPFELN